MVARNSKLLNFGDLIAIKIFKLRTPTLQKIYLKKMNTIGLRVSPSEVTYAIYDSVKNNIQSVDEIVIPKSMSVPQSLKYVRNTVLDIIREYNVSRAGIRTVEPIAQSLSIERIQIEGVIQEALASSSVEKYYSGPIATIAAKNNMPRDEFKRCTGKDGEHDRVENWKGHSEKEKEAILAALGAVNA